MRVNLVPISHRLLVARTPSVRQIWAHVVLSDAGIVLTMSRSEVRVRPEMACHWRSQQGIGEKCGLVARCLRALSLSLCLAAPVAAQVTEILPPLEVGTTLSGFSTNGIDVAQGADGNILFLWDNGNNYPTQAAYPADWNSLSARVFTKTGVPVGPVTRVDVNGNVDPWVFAGANGDGYLAAWQVAFPGTQGMDVYLRGRRLDAHGLPVGGELLIDPDPASSKDVPIVAGLRDGGSAVAWLDAGTIEARTFDSAASATSPIYKVEPTPTSWYGHDVAGLRDGAFVVVWSGHYPSFASSLRLYSADGNPLTPPLPVSRTFLATDVAANPDGGFVVIGKTWGDKQLWLRLFAADGTPQSDDVLVHSMSTDYYISQEDVAFGASNLLVEWVDFTRVGYPGIFGKVFDPQGTPLTGDIRINSMPAVRLRATRLDDGHVVNAWEWMSQYNVGGTAVWANILSICEGDTCAVPGNTPTPTRTTTAPPTVRENTPTPAPYCGDGTVGDQEECDDGNRSSGDGCDRACRIEDCGNGRVEGIEACDDGNLDAGDGCEPDCTHTPYHDSVMVPEKAIDVTIPAGQPEVTKVVPVQVRNADAGERPGHVIQLIAEDHTCPIGTIVGLPDFERGAEGDQDSLLVMGGTPKTALVTVRVRRQDYEGLDAKVPKRCLVRFTAQTLLPGNVDPTPENNAIVVELNVVAAAGNNSDGSGLATTLLPEFFIASAKPLRLKIAAGTSASRKSIPLAIGLGNTSANLPSRALAVAVDPGTCPSTAFGGVDFGGGQSEVQVNAGQKRRGRMLLTIASQDLVFSRGRAARCQARVVVTSRDGDSAAASHVTNLVVEVVDAHTR